MEGELDENGDPPVKVGFVRVYEFLHGYTDYPEEWLASWRERMTPEEVNFVETFDKILQEEINNQVLADIRK